MKKVKHVAVPTDDDLSPEYGPAAMRAGVRGKYAQRFREGTNLILLDPDVAQAFPDAQAVNAALRLLMDVARQTAPRST
jgi:hypothetical protein